MIKTANPTMITLARELRGKRQNELADELKVTQAAVSKIESGQILADDKQIAQLSKFLHFPESFFYEPFEIYPAPMQFYRKHKTLPKRFARSIEATINAYRLHISKLLKSAEIEFTEIPDCDLDEYESASEVARAVRQYLRLPCGAVDSIVDILEELGIVVISFDAGTRLFSGVVSLVVNTENFIIMVNSQMPPDRLRWTLAHELAHLIMHRLPTKTMEEEADEFAGEFLMPSEDLAYELENIDVEKLAGLKRYYKTSMSAIVTSANKRGLLSDWKARNLWVELAKQKITRKQEPTLNLEKEEPTLLNELVDYHLNELEYTVGELSQFLGLMQDEFLQMYQPEIPQRADVKHHNLRLVS